MLFWKYIKRAKKKHFEIFVINENKQTTKFVENNDDALNLDNNLIKSLMSFEFRSDIQKDRR